MIRRKIMAMLMGGKIDMAGSIFRDIFSVTLAGGAVDGSSATPGKGTRNGTDTENVLLVTGGRLRGGGQVTPVWGESRIYWATAAGAGWARQTGRVVAAVIIPEDTITDSDLAFGWDTAVDTTDPRIVGHGWLVEDNLNMAINPGVKSIISGSREVNPIQYLCIVALNDAGYYLLLSTIGASVGTPMTDPLGVPAYPSARVVWASNSGAAATLYPYVSYLGRVSGGYPNGNSLEDLRVIDVTTWAAADFLANAADRFTRGDSNTSLGGNWSVITASGVFGISSNQAYLVSGPNAVQMATLATTIYDGIYEWDFKVPADGVSGKQIGTLMRIIDNANYIRFTPDGGNNFKLQVFESGSYHAAIFGTAYTWTNDVTYRITVIAYGNKYRIFVNGSAIDGGSWQTDAGNHNLTATGIGLYAHPLAMGTVRWDNVACTPLTVTLPTSVFSLGKVPLVVAGGTTLATDTFTDDDATRLNVHSAEAGGAWTEHAGAWTISSNRATCSAAAGENFSTQVCASNVEAQLEIITPGSFASDTIRCGIVVRYIDTNNNIYARIFMDAAQAGNDEIELIEKIGGAGTIVKKVNLANYFAASTTYTLKVQAYNDQINVFLDGKPFLSYYTQTGSPTGTRAGIYEENTDDGCTYDNWSVKAL